MGACHLWPTHRSGRAGISDAAVSRSTCFLARAEEKVGRLWCFTVYFFPVAFRIYTGNLCWSISKGANSFPFCLLVSWFSWFLPSPRLIWNFERHPCFLAIRWRFNWRMEAIIFQPFCFLSVRTWGRWPTLNSHWQSPGNGYTVTLRG